ncbi:hypothetical protein [Flavobacterium sp.]|uniref:hypothetical protein n=1 Tax=Flavobacterium sp. TaxID=239 RepID=UPI003B9D2A13
MKRILITGVGGPTPRSFAISLKKYSKFSDVKLFATDVNPLAIGLYQRDLFEKSFVVPLAKASNYWNEIEKIVNENQIDFAVILPEAEVMEWCKKERNSKLPCPAFLPSVEMAELLIDKSRMTEVLNDSGLVPKSVTFDRNISDFSEIFTVLKGNFWVRSSSGTSGLGSLKVEDEEALRNWIQINPNVQTFLASEFLSGRNLACKLLYENGKLLRAACAERVNYIMAKVAPSGITGNTSFGRLLNEPELVDVATKAMDLLFEATNSAKHGFFTVDFKEDADGRPYITEVNVRHVAFTQCFAAGGANFAEATISLLTSDQEFDKSFKMYEFEKDLIFLRDVDNLPIIMKETDLYTKS